MNVVFLLKQYFDNRQDVSIDVYDAHALSDVYHHKLTSKNGETVVVDHHIDIENSLAAI